MVDEKLSYEKGHKDSKGNDAPWVIRSHKDNRVLASFARKEDAEEHLRRMSRYSKNEDAIELEVVQVMDISKLGAQYKCVHSVPRCFEEGKIYTVTDVWADGWFGLDGIRVPAQTFKNCFKMVVDKRGNATESAQRWYIEYEDVYANKKKECFEALSSLQHRYDELALRVGGDLGDILWVRGSVLNSTVKSRLYERYERMVYFKGHRKLSESMSDWAENEVKLACKNEDGYGKGCYQSALKAYRSLCDDDHSGFSFGRTKMILGRLMDGLPLTPVDDVPENWNNISGEWGEPGHYQSNRMSSLFKEVKEDGTVAYNDVDRTILICVADDGTETSWSSGWADDMVDELYGPIAMPYYPTRDKYRVYVRQFDSVKAEPGCYDTQHLIKILDPSGEVRHIDKYYAEGEDGKFHEIGVDEYGKRLSSYKKAKE